MKLSFSAISAYKNCPLSYKFMYIDKLPVRRNPLLSFGTSLHATLAKFYNVTVPKAPSLEKLLELLFKNWEKDGYQGDAEEKLYLDHAKQVLTNFYYTNISHFKIPTAIEQRFELELDSCTIRGILDRMDRLTSGGYEIIDYKTGRRLPPQSKVDDDLQLSIYYMAAKEVWGIEPERLTLYFLIPNQKMVTTRNDEDIFKTKEVIEKVVAEILAKKFGPEENALCPWCDFQIHCPLYKHKFLKQEGKISSEEIKKVVDEYASLKMESKKNRTRLLELQEIIHNYCEEHDLSRLYSERAIISRRTQVFSSYDRERLKEVLEPLGLWDKVVKVDHWALQKILESENLKKEVKQAIEKAKEAENITYVLYVRENRESLSGGV